MPSKRKTVLAMKVNVFGDIVPVYKQHGLMAATGWMGCYDPNSKIIKIDSDLVGYDFETTLVHEIFEAAWFRLSFGQAVDDKLKEVIIDNLSKAVVENFNLKGK